LSSSDRTWLHFAGVGGSGMSALALFHAEAGGIATGSDRAFDRGERREIRAALAAAGVRITPQDGSYAGLAGEFGRSCDALVVSTAVEETVPDVRAARDAAVAILHRSELLARHVADHRTIAVTGTSGKSTVTAMIWTILAGCGRGPGLLTGGALADLRARGGLGNAAGPRGEEKLLVIEADESDGSLVRYRPWCGVVLNLGLDHKSPAEVRAMFDTFADRTTGPLVVGAEENLADYAPAAVRFGIGPDPRPGVWAADVAATPGGSTFTVDGVPFTVPTPGRHDVLNALAALAACRETGLGLADMAGPLAGFGGVARRFNVIGTAGGVTVIDDFAHNPDKIAAALETARDRAGDGRVLAVFQPHGYGPTRFLREALVATFAAALRDRDVLWLPEIYYAGGTVTRDVSSGDLVAAVRAGDRDARFVPERGDLTAAVAAEARPGDVVLVMGARDPSLTDFCRGILARLG
jgi:UDP-N-acetylmuramate--alanine ligase